MVAQSRVVRRALPLVGGCAANERFVDSSVPVEGVNGRLRKAELGMPEVGVSEKGRGAVLEANEWRAKNLPPGPSGWVDRASLV